MPKLSFARRAPHPDRLLACLLGSFVFLIAALAWSAPRLFAPAPEAAPRTALQTTPQSPVPAALIGTRVAPSTPRAAASPENAASLLDTSLLDGPIAQLVAATSRPERIIRVGLSTAGEPIQIWTPSPATITDALQPGREVTVQAGDTIRFAHEAEFAFSANGRSYRGPIRIRTGTGDFRAWHAPRVAVQNGPARVTTDGHNPRWGRPYRGGFEITEAGYSFEPAKHRGPLALVNIVPLEEYLQGVVPWEMNPDAPFEALKAQAICARSETLSKIATGRHAKDGFDICDYDHCQGYPGTENEKPATTRAVQVTRGIVLYYNGRIADAVYGTNSGGITASSGDVWRGTPPPYLQSVFDFSPRLHPAMAKVVKPRMSEADWLRYCSQNLPSFAQPSQAEIAALAARRRQSARTAALYGPDDLPEFYRWTREISPTELAAAVSRVMPMATVTELRVLERAASGHIKRLQVRGKTAAGTDASALFEGDSQIRAMLSGRLGSTTALPSSTFVPLARRGDDGQITAFVLKGAGWGHGVGMCQRGAQNRARAGEGARQILHHYFRGVKLLLAQ